MSDYTCVLTSAFCCHLQIGSLLPGGQSALISIIKQDGHWQWLQKWLILPKFMSPTPVLLAALFSQHKVTVVRKESLAINVKSFINKWKQTNKYDLSEVFVCWFVFGALLLFLVAYPILCPFYYAHTTLVLQHTWPWINLMLWVPKMHTIMFVLFGDHSICKPGSWCVLETAICPPRLTVVFHLNTGCTASYIWSHLWF